MGIRALKVLPTPLPPSLRAFPDFLENALKHLARRWGGGHMTEPEHFRPTSRAPPPRMSPDTVFWLLAPKLCILYSFHIVIYIVLYSYLYSFIYSVYIVYPMDFT